MNAVKLALIGCGDVAQRDYLPEMHRLAGRAEIVAVCGRTAKRARSVAAEYGIARWYDDFDCMLAETEADAVLNLTPIQTHAETTLAALQAGKHVYSEKPVASTVSDARRIQVEAAERELTLICAPSVMLFPQVQFARSLVARGAVGALWSVTGQGHGGVPPWRGYPSDPSPFFARGGGPLMDMGVYPLHAITGIFGPARRVSAYGSRARESFVVDDGPYAGRQVPIETDDTWALLLDLGEGRMATVTANNSVQASRAPQLELHGLGGTIAVNLLDVAAPVELFQPESGWQRHQVSHARAGGPDHLLGIEHLVDCITTGAGPKLSIDQAIHVLEIIEAAERSARSGRAIEVTSTFPQLV